MIGIRRPRRFQLRSGSGFKRRTGEGSHGVHFQRLRADTRERGTAALIRLIVLLGVVVFLIRWLAR